LACQLVAAKFLMYVVILNCYQIGINYCCNTELNTNMNTRNARRSLGLEFSSHFWARRTYSRPVWPDRSKQRSDYTSLYSE